MIARNAGALEEQRDYLQETYGVEVLPKAMDLCNPEAFEQIIELTKEIEVGFYAHVASTSPLGPYLDAPLDRHHQALGAWACL